MKLLPLANLEADNILTNLICTQNYTNVFNPSILEFDNNYYVVFRCMGTKDICKFESILIKFNVKNNRKDTISLSLYCQKFGISNCADPKLVMLDNEIWVTFNTGYNSIQNDIYLLRISNELGIPSKCILKGRKSVEKNWAFYKFKGELRAIYSLSPFQNVRLKWLDYSRNEFHFEFENVDFNKINSRRINLSIGTQLVYAKNNSFLIAHQKIYFGSKKIYFGRFIRISEDYKNLQISSNVLFHSYFSLLGSIPKRNKNLISCSYFSGLILKGNNYIISYGINDLSFAIKKVNISSIWD